MYLTALLGGVEGGENVDRPLLSFLRGQYMKRGTRTHTRPSAITMITAVLTVPAIRPALLPGTGVWIGEAASVSGVRVRIGETNGMSDRGIQKNY